MIKSTIYLTFVMLVLGVGAANAQTFTFEGKGDEPTVVGGVGPKGDTYIGTYGTGNEVAINADGSKVKSTSKCVSMTQPPNANIFDAHVVCDVSGTDGTFSIVAGCNSTNAEAREMNCVGGMTGKTGELEGRSGTISWRAKGDVSKGTGQWHE